MTTAVQDNPVDLGGLIDNLSAALRNSESGALPSSSVSPPSSGGIPTESGGATERYVGVRIGGESFVLPMSGVLEIQRLPALTPLPGIAEWLIGVTNFH